MGGVGAVMKRLATEQDLRALFSADEIEAYLGSQWGTDRPTDMVTDVVSMRLDSPAQGHVIIKGGYKSGANNYVIKVSTSLYSSSDPEVLNERLLTLVGDAQSGVITALLVEGAPAPADLPAIDIPEIDWQDIQGRLAALGHQQVCQLQKDGFVAFSAGDVTIPDVLHMRFKDQDGDLHLKGAHRRDGDIFVLKIATGFYGNLTRGISSHQGVMLAFDAETGDPIMVLKDEGHLTDLRTAISGRNAADEMMRPEDLTGIGMLGTGVQARLQIEQLESLYPDCRKLTVWGHTAVNAQKYADEMTGRGWNVTIAASPKSVADHSNLIITTTPTQVALLDADDIETANTLIISIGADMPGKVELSPALLRAAPNVVIDSISQGKDHGNAADAIKRGIISEDDLQEFGDMVSSGLRHAEHAKNLRLFLSSGIGVQDLQIVEAVIAGS